MSNLLKTVQGSRTFESNPVWDLQPDTVINVELAKHPDIMVVPLKYGHALKQDDTYILLKNGVSPSKDTYRVGTFIANQDWSSDEGDGHIAKGEVKAMAF